MENQYAKEIAESLKAIAEELQLIRTLLQHIEEHQRKGY